MKYTNFKGDRNNEEEYCQDYLKVAEKLGEELEAMSFDIEINKGDDYRTEFNVLVHNFDGYTYKILKGWKGGYIVNLLNNKYYKNVSPSKRGEIYKETHKSNNMNVLNYGKIQNKMDEEKEYHRLMEIEDIQKGDRVKDFLETLAESGEDIKYYYKRDYNNDNKIENTKEIEGGYINKGGLNYEFSISSDGYISQKITTSFNGSNCLATFKAMADNKYKPEIEK